MNNVQMETFGHIQNGVVVLDEGANLPEGARVCVSVLPTGVEKPQIECKPGQLPLVRGGVPGSMNLTNERIHAILEAEDVEAVKRQWNVPS